MYTLEVCTENVEDSVIATRNGANRIELNSALALGGLTPSLGLFLQVRTTIKIPIIVMIRPRPGNFHYTQDERAVMERDILKFWNHGADGFAIGSISSGDTIDSVALATFMKLAPSAQWVFHRAFDDLPSLADGMEELVSLGISRILTSGGAATAHQGLEALTVLQQQAKNRIQILPASGISPTNAEQILTTTGCTQLHGSFSAAKALVATHPSRFDCIQKKTNGTSVAAIRRIMNTLER